MSKPKLLMIYDYEMPPHQNRVTHSSPYILEQALKEFFDVYRFGEIEGKDADLTFNTLPLVTKGGTGPDLFTLGKLTSFWTPSPLEGIGNQYFEQCDIIFNSIPSWAHKMPEGKTVTLLDFIDDSYHEYPEEKVYDVGFLGSEIEGTRIDLLNKIGERFKLFRGSTELGEDSARALSKCKLVISIQDWNWHNAGIEKRLFTFGNIRPILIRYNEDYDAVGKPYEHYIPYKNDDDCLKQISYFLQNMDKAETIGNNLKTELQHHTARDRAKTILETYENKT